MNVNGLHAKPEHVIVTCARHGLFGEVTGFLDKACPLETLANFSDDDKHVAIGSDELNFDFLSGCGL